jgi:GH43 family beta-xylosidase
MIAYCSLFLITKKMSTHRLFQSIILIAIISFGSCTNAVSQGFSNPISPYGPDDFPDPSVVYYEGNYYGLHSENGSSEIWVYKHNTLDNLFFKGKKTKVFTAPQNSINSEAIWAPRLQYIQGKWYIYYTASYGGKVENHRMFALEGNTQDPQGSYYDYSTISATNTNFYAIDGRVIVKPTDGSLYFVWSGTSKFPQQNIYIAPMGDPTYINGLAVMISGTNANWESAVHESPDFIYKNGKSILSYSTGGLLDPGPGGYKTGTLTNTDGNYLSAKSWKKSSGAVFEYYSGADGEVYAPGATRFVKSADGTEDWLVYHAKHFNDNNYNREYRAQKFTWDSNDVPLFEHPIPSGVIMPVPSGDESLAAAITSGESYKIVARNSSLALTVQLSSKQPRALVEQRSFTGSDNQNWEITNLGNGYYKIISKNTGLALSITNSSIDKGATLEQQTYSGQDHQQWKISNLGNRYHVITSKFSQKCMDVTGNASTEGALINQWPYLGGYNQHWSLVNITLSETSFDLKNIVNIYPNPTSDTLFVEFNELKKDVSYEIVDVAGKTIYHKSTALETKMLEINVSSFRSGTYFLKLKSDNFVSTKKFIKD